MDKEPQEVLKEIPGTSLDQVENLTPELQAVINRYPAAKLFPDRLPEVFGPCDVTVIEEPEADPPDTTTMFKLIYAYNNYVSRINKAEDYFRTAAPDQASKFKPVYDELIVKAVSALNEIRDIRAANQFDIYSYQDTPEGYIQS